MQNISHCIRKGHSRRSSLLDQDGASTILPISFELFIPAGPVVQPRQGHVVALRGSASRLAGMRPRSRASMRKLEEATKKHTPCNY